MAQGRDAHLTAMRWILLAAVLLAACSGRSVLEDSGAAMPAAIDAGSTADSPDAAGLSASAADAGSVSDAGNDSCCSATDAGLASSDAGPQPPPPATLTPIPPPDSMQQTSAWISTGAAGCDGGVPSRPPVRFSWTTTAFGCSAQGADGEGDLAAEFDNDAAGIIYGLLFVPVAGMAGNMAAYDRNVRVTSRPAGFFLDQAQLGSGDWFSPVDAAGNELASPFFVGGWWTDLTPDPRGGYVEQHDRLASDPTGTNHHFELRWVDHDLTPRTDWVPVTSWQAMPPGDVAGAWIDTSGRALVEHAYEARLPCPGSHNVDAFWASESGTVSPFAPAVTTTPTTSNCAPNVGMGTPLRLDDGGFAFFQAAYPGTSPTGWFAFYGSGSTTSTAPPSWLNAYNWIEPLSNGAYLDIQTDATTCTRSARIIGNAGQVCATVALEGSNDCSARDHRFTDGTLVQDVANSCSLTWWPRLGR